MCTSGMVVGRNGVSACDRSRVEPVFVKTLVERGKNDDISDGERAMLPCQLY